MNIRDHKDELVNQMSSKLIFVAAEKKLYEVIIALLDDGVYTKEDAVEDIIKVLSLLRWEKETVRNEMREIIDIGE